MTEIEAEKYAEKFMLHACDSFNLGLWEFRIITDAASTRCDFEYSKYNTISLYLAEADYVTVSRLFVVLVHEFTHVLQHPFADYHLVICDSLDSKAITMANSIWDYFAEKQTALLEPLVKERMRGFSV